MLAATRQRFLDDYIKIRHAEGRGSQDAAYYLALPYRDITGRLQDQWTIRAKSYRYLESRVLPPIEKQCGRPLRIADLGAGNCWLSYRLALRGHRPIAIDILGDPLDGLAAGRHYQERTPFPRVNAEFDDLPLAAGSLDLAIYNASIHYSTDYRRTLAEIRRVPASRRRLPDCRFAGVPAPRARRNDGAGAPPADSRRPTASPPTRCAASSISTCEMLARTGARSGHRVEGLPPVVRLAMGAASVEGALARQASALAISGFWPGRFTA